VFVKSFGSFPERSNGDQVQDTLFYYRLEALSSPIEPAPTYLPTEIPSSFLYGYCAFSQRRDSTAKRKFGQKSLVLISHHEFPAFFSKIVDLVLSLDATVGPDTLESACAHIASWSDPVVGLQRLPFLGTLLDVDM